MKAIKCSLIAFILVSMAGCYLPITGRVIDAETQQPIEGAVVLVEWTKTHGFGEYWTESYKVYETLSDKDGNVHLAGCYSPFINPPEVTVYKKGYVAWNNKYEFPSNNKRMDFEWRSGNNFNLKPFVSLYSYLDHQSFILRSAHPERNSEYKQTFRKQYYDSESEKILEEQNKKDEMRKGKDK